MTKNRFRKIVADKERCEFCPDSIDEDICIKCDMVEPITVSELYDYYRTVKELNKTVERLKAENARLNDYVRIANA